MTVFPSTALIFTFGPVGSDAGATRNPVSGIGTTAGGSGTGSALAPTLFVSASASGSADASLGGISATSFGSGTASMSIHNPTASSQTMSFDGAWTWAIGGAVDGPLTEFALASVFLQVTTSTGLSEIVVDELETAPSGAHPLAFSLGDSDDVSDGLTIGPSETVLLTLFVDAFGSAEAAKVAEPASLILLGAGLAGLAAWRRRRA